MASSTWYLKCPWCKEIYTENEGGLYFVEDYGGEFNDKGRFGDCAVYNLTCPHCGSEQSLSIEYLERYDIKKVSPGNRALGNGSFSISALIPEKSGSSFDSNCLFGSFNRRLRRFMKKTI